MIGCVSDFLARANQARVQKLWLERQLAMQQDSERLTGLGEPAPLLDWTGWLALNPGVDKYERTGQSS